MPIFIGTAPEKTEIEQLNAFDLEKLNKDPMAHIMLLKIDYNIIEKCLEIRIVFNGCIKNLFQKFTMTVLSAFKVTDEEIAEMQNHTSEGNELLLELIFMSYSHTRTFLYITKTEIHKSPENEYKDFLKVMQMPDFRMRDIKKRYDYMFTQDFFGSAGIG
ncbi:MAG: hypothetical protein SFY32_16805 [Bacteroidota bacterium]|nr:hypothetical protein [Bacteroidota bacterium]